MKKRITAVLVFALILGMLAGCGGASEPAGSALSPAESASGSTEDSSTRVGSVELFFFRNEFALVYRFGSAR